MSCLRIRHDTIGWVLYRDLHNNANRKKVLQKKYQIRIQDRHVASFTFFGFRRFVFSELLRRWER